MENEATNNGNEAADLEVEAAGLALTAARERLRLAKIAQKAVRAERARMAKAAEKARLAVSSAAERAVAAEAENAGRLGFYPGPAKEVAGILLAANFVRESGWWVRDEKAVVLNRSGWMGMERNTWVPIGLNDDQFIGEKVRAFVG